MKRATKLFPTAFYLAGLVVGLGANTARAEIHISLFGNLGESGFEQPWYDDGGPYITPPYREDYRYRGYERREYDRDDRRRDEHERRAAPERREDRREIPSIPNNRRPDYRRSDDRNNRDQRR